jgi:AraC family transcriptional regulator
MQGVAGGRRGSARALAPWQVHRAIELLISDTSGHCSVSMLARSCGLSASHFAHAFKASTGVPPHRWLSLHRVQRAREMIESTGESLSAIAVTCGYADQSHLTRAFRSIIGTSPAAWRRQRRMGVTASELELPSDSAAFGVDRVRLRPTVVATTAD